VGVQVEGDQAGGRGGEGEEEGAGWWGRAAAEPALTPYPAIQGGQDVAHAAVDGGGDDGQGDEREGAAGGAEGAVGGKEGGE